MLCFMYGLLSKSNQIKRIFIMSFGLTMTGLQCEEHSFCWAIPHGPDKNKIKTHEYDTFYSLSKGVVNCQNSNHSKFIYT